MTTITINKRTKAGKLLLEMAKVLVENAKNGISIVEDKEDKSSYNPEFVAMIKKAEKRGKYTEVKDVKKWIESL